MKDLILIGGGGHCKSIIDVAESAGYNILGILDKSSEVGKRILAYSVIGTDEDISLYACKAAFVITVGHMKNVSIREKLHQLVVDAGGSFEKVIASTAYVSKYASIGDGTVIMHHAMVNAGACIGKECIINTFANIEHDAQIGDFCHISTGAMINGGCCVGNGTFVGSQSVLSNAVTVSAGCLIGAGSFVRKNILVPGIYSGNPAILKIKL